MKDISSVASYSTTSSRFDPSKSSSSDGPSSSSSSSSPLASSPSLNHVLDGLFSLLNYKERQILTEQRELTENARTLAAQVGGREVSDLLHNTASLNFLQELQLQSTFSVVLAGEFNAGKSTLLNALLGQELLESGALPTTDTITIVAANKSMPNENEADADDDAESITDNKNHATDAPKLPLGVTLHLVPDMPLLQDLTLIDTPGTNSTWMDHTERTLRLLPSADLILFVTSADRPFSESERTLLKSIQSYRKSIVVIVNKMDILPEESQPKILEFVQDNASELLGARPIVIPVSSRNALSVKLQAAGITPNTVNQGNVMGGTANQLLLSSAEQIWKDSNFGALESFLRDSLTTQTRIRSKLTSPLGVAEGLMVQCLETLKKEKQELEADLSTLNILKSQLEGWEKELQRDLDASKERIVKTVTQEGTTVELLFSRMSVFQFYAWGLLSSNKNNATMTGPPHAKFLKEWDEAKLQQASLHKSNDLKEELLEQVYETADSVASRGRAQGQVVVEYLGNRPTMKNQSLIGSVTATSRFEDTRKHLGKLMAEAVQSTLQGRHAAGGGRLDKNKNANEERDSLYASIQQLAMASAALQTGGVMTGLVTLGEFLDPFTGIALSSSLVLGGSACYVVGTSRLAKGYQEDWDNRAQRLGNSLDGIFTKELDKVNRRIMDGVAPYTRFVESEQERIDKLRDECDGLATAARSLRNRVFKLS
ncbi:unnamed protein product [Cylindrotheca closterium]|uniref:Dynamin N-terminal domain-containing protein n=1 Tax=Cylindrotheca closterium TaxID=2856 RepID=A0AAD2CIW7_9STRA|nr:unnamed protein product [Cylindrotheca closterium]